MRESRTLTRRAIDSALGSSHTDSAAFYLAEEAAREALAGNSELAIRQAKSALRQSNSRDAESAAGLALALAGETATASLLAADLEKRFPEDTLLRNRYLPMLRAALALKAGAPQQAIEQLAVATPYELGSQAMAHVAFFTCYPMYLRGKAYMAAGQSAPAIREFEKLSGQTSLTLTDPVGALARLELARAWARANEWRRSRQFYGEALAYWKDADADFLPARQAAQEVSALRP